jgi:hypothetical protein
MVLANTGELHEKIEHLRSRVRELEDGLRALQSTASDQPHPLLREDLLSIKAPTAGSSTTRPNNSSPQAGSSKHAGREGAGDDDSLIDAFGMVHCCVYTNHH